MLTANQGASTFAPTPPECPPRLSSMEDNRAPRGWTEGQLAFMIQDREGAPTGRQESRVGCFLLGERQMLGAA